ncbi:MAG TPA: hypothetical protein VJ481_00260 [Patescibacteria group bacterium]|uniref:Glycosyltransferase RgtA/B/C/D-like domain-containing protein n=1 Tax=Candidatus Woesebacteria bacterium RBG_13_46_13 TaxID=1802479 RepID=A0A1F7X4Y9_9BACT|nr:MAG: hypothetical protein A2Y68_00130 [Candidatus Woesebacteria bacterium RBG_13_46_13]HJX58975.1 hypothetical protein [Patescibacteria group bacterium]
MLRKLFLVLVLGLSIVVFILGKDVLHTTDAQRYAVLANNLVSGRGYTLNGFPELIFPPGFSLLIVPLVLLGLSLDLSVAIVMATGYFLLGLAILLLTKEFFEEKIAMLASLFVLVNGNLILWSVLGYAEILLFGFLLMAAYFFIAKKKNVYLSGFLAGLAFLIKPEALIHIFLFLSVLYLFRRKTFVEKLKKFSLPLLLIIFAYSSYLFIHTGKLAVSGKVATLEWVRYIEDKNLTAERIFYRNNEDGTLGPTIKNYSLSGINLKERVRLNLISLKQASFEILLPLKIVLVVIFLNLLFIPKTRKLFLLLAPFVLPISISLVFQIEQRFLFPLILFTIFFLAHALLLPFKSKGKLLTGGILLASLLTLLAMTYYSYYPLRKEIPNLKREKAEILSFVSLIGNVPLILSRKPVYSYFAGADYYPLPWVETEGDFEKYLNKHNGGLIILDDWSRNTLPETESVIRNNFLGKVQLIEHAAN